MVKIQLDLTDEQDKKVSIYKVENDFKTKAEAIGDIIEKNV